MNSISNRELWIWCSASTWKLGNRSREWLLQSKRDREREVYKVCRIGPPHLDIYSMFLERAPLNIRVHAAHDHDVPIRVPTHVTLSLAHVIHIFVYQTSKYAPHMTHKAHAQLNWFSKFRFSPVRAPFMMFSISTRRSWRVLQLFFS